MGSHPGGGYGLQTLSLLVMRLVPAVLKHLWISPSMPPEATQQTGFAPPALEVSLKAKYCSA